MADLLDGETTEIKGSARKSCVVKNTGGVSADRGSCGYCAKAPWRPLLRLACRLGYVRVGPQQAIWHMICGQ